MNEMTFASAIKWKFGIRKETCKLVFCIYEIPPSVKKDGDCVWVFVCVFTCQKLYANMAQCYGGKARHRQRGMCGLIMC